MEKEAKRKFLIQQIDLRKKALDEVNDKLAEADELEARAEALRKEAGDVNGEKLKEEITALEELKKDYEEPSDSDVETVPEDPGDTSVSGGGVN